MKDFDDYNGFEDFEKDLDAENIEKSLEEKSPYEEYELDSQEYDLYQKADEKTIDYYTMGEKSQSFMDKIRTEEVKDETGKKVEPIAVNQPNTYVHPHYFEEHVKPKRKRSMFKRVVAAALALCVATGTGIGIGFHFSSSKQENESLVADANTAGNSESGTSGGFSFSDTEKETTLVSNFSSTANNQTVPEMLKHVTPAVVNIVSTIEMVQQSYFSGYTMPFEYDAAGSGIIFHEDDEKIYIVTNNHVIEEAKAITVTLEDTHQVPATIVGSDSQSDLGVIYVMKSDLQMAGVTNITIATFGDSDSLQLGEQVIAIGNALGEGQSITGGWISALGRQIPLDGRILELIQTDAAINNGNSGGALVNMSGEVIGVNTAKISQRLSSNTIVEGMGYAIPSNTLKPIVEEIMNYGYVQRPYLGINPLDITEEMAALYQLPIGVFVNNVIAGSGADIAGLTRGDVIIEFEGQKILDKEALNEAIAEKQVGDTVKLRIIRNGVESLEVSVVLQDANMDNVN